ncbi:hypothetical protein B0H14DRAFT_3854210 [Mycena olivaceomarginata]|nr:hypothetical protein B0H14DRAFT_3854210 [Mycena olivaceomarginata]
MTGVMLRQCHIDHFAAGLSPLPRDAHPATTPRYTSPLRVGVSVGTAARTLCPVPSPSVPASLRIRFLSTAPSLHPGTMLAPRTFTASAPPALPARPARRRRLCPAPFARILPCLTPFLPLSPTPFHALTLALGHPLCLTVVYPPHFPSFLAPFHVDRRTPAVINVVPSPVPRASTSTARYVSLTPRARRLHRTHCVFTLSPCTLISLPAWSSPSFTLALTAAPRVHLNSAAAHVSTSQLHVARTDSAVDGPYPPNLGWASNVP